MVMKYDLSGFYNLREAGGIHVRGGKLRTKKLLRSGFPESFDQADIKFFLGLPLSVVVDLRDAEEAQMSPDFFERAGFNVVRNPIFAGSASSMMLEIPTLEQLYAGMLDDSATALAGAVEDVATGVKTGAALVHCTAGKDRTGIVIALIQSLLGASRADVVANYCATSANLSGVWLQQKMEMIQELTAIYPQLADVNMEALKSLIAGSPPEAIESVLDTVDTDYGGVETFLRENGLPQQAIEDLEEHLVQPIPN